MTPVMIMMAGPACAPGALSSITLPTGSGVPRADYATVVQPLWNGTGKGDDDFVQFGFFYCGKSPFITDTNQPLEGMTATSTGSKPAAPWSRTTACTASGSMKLSSSTEPCASMQ